MVQLLSKTVIALLCIVISGSCFSQPVTNSPSQDDYKDPKTHEKFRKRRMAVSAWQINKLKQGALVVRLKTNHLLLNELRKRGDDHLAEKARLEQAAINFNTMRAYLDNYKFSKVYFIFSNSSDSLLNGTRKGIFLDTNLRVDPSITMTEDFYLIAENDYVYNSSIGFVREDSAKYVTESGNPSSQDFPIVVKNKYGHQLKNPFPYSQGKTVFVKPMFLTDVNINGTPVTFVVSSLGQMVRSSGTRSPGTYMYNGKPIELSIPRSMTYDALSVVVENFDIDLEQFYRSSPNLSEKNLNYQDAKPFFY